MGSCFDPTQGCMSIQGSTFQGLENIHPGKAPWPSIRSEALTTSATPAVRNQCGKTATLNLRRDWVGQSGGKAREQTPAAVPVRRPGEREQPSLSSQSVAVTVAPPTLKPFSANIGPSNAVPGVRHGDCHNLPGQQITSRCCSKLPELPILPLWHSA